MKWKILLLLFACSTTSHAYVNLRDSWSEDGGYKMARDDQYPSGFSTNTISRCWDGTTIKLFGAKGELLSWVTYLLAGSSAASNVMVRISSFTGTGSIAGSGFSAVTVSSTNVWDYTNRPYSLYKYGYVQIVGSNEGESAWDPTEFEERQFPVRFRDPYIVNGSNQGVPTTKLWATRPDHDKFYPDAAVPIEEFSISSFTVLASSSQAIGGEVYISTAMLAGTYTAQLTVYEGAVISTTIPISLIVYNVNMPTKPIFPIIAYVGNSDLDVRLNGTRNPANEFVEPYLTNHLRVAAFLHRHKVIEIGDTPLSTTDFPSIEYAKHIDGSAYKEAYGLSSNSSPGYGIPDSFYMIGTYGHWRSIMWSTTTISGSNGFCTNVSSWTAYCASNNLNCQLYTDQDEASSSVLSNEVNTLSTWLSTATECANTGNRISFFQTSSLPIVAPLAPNANAIASADWVHAASATWISYESIYQNSSTHSAWGYNAFPGSDSILTIQEGGLGSREPMWGMYKTNQAGWFLWELNYWNDLNNPGQLQNGFNADANNDNNVFNISKTFGYDIYPSTNSDKGHYGFNFANGDGTMLYPATDVIYANPSYGFNGVIGSWRLNMLTRGVQDADLLHMAYAINSSSTTNLMNNVIQDVMYLRQCVDLGDCTYVFGDRPWSENPNLYETTRESLLQIIASGPFSNTLKGHVAIKGNLRFR